MNNHVMSRLEGLRKMLLASHESNATMSSASKGREREDFISLFLSRTLPPPYRFGGGDITDVRGRRNGQVDIVVEYPFLPAIPSIAGDIRLYLSESVAAVIEVKSNISAQWAEASQTSQNVKRLHRDLRNFTREMHGGTFSMSGGSPSISGMTIDGRNAPPGVRAGIEISSTGMKILGQDVSSTLPIPVFAIGYNGWKTIDGATSHLVDNNIDGILILDHGGIFVAGERYGQIVATGSAALWAFICCLHKSTKELSKISTDPLAYALNNPN